MAKYSLFFFFSFLFLFRLEKRKKSTNDKMGETDEKENVPAGTPTAEIEEPKETEKLLNRDVKKSELGSPIDVNSDKEPVSDEKKRIEESMVKVNGDEVIEIPESTDSEKKAKGEGREVKPRKIPIGGIKMPGFFTKKSKPVEKDGAEGELLENAGNETKSNEEAKEERPATANPKKRFLSSVKMPELPKVHFPFGFKKASPPKDVEAEDGNVEEKPDEKTEMAEGKIDILQFLIKYLILNCLVCLYSNYRKACGRGEGQRTRGKTRKRTIE